MTDSQRSSAEPLASLLARFRQRDRRALSRLLSLAARGEQIEAIDEALEGDSRRAFVAAVTGNGGVGKSTLIGRLIEHVRDLGQSIAVLACDPQSGVTGGALLGDRVRMPPRPADEGVFVRSLATPAGQQSVAPRIGLMTRLLSSYGFNNVIIETVGAGQGDIAVRELADVVLVLVQPESGDEVQWEKAGILEIADVVVVHKADLPGAEAVESQVREHLNLPGAAPIPIVSASASKRQGLAKLWETAARRPTELADV